MFLAKKRLAKVRPATGTFLLSERQLFFYYIGTLFPAIL